MVVVASVFRCRWWWTRERKRSERVVEWSMVVVDLVPVVVAGGEDRRLRENCNRGGVSIGFHRATEV